MRVFCLFLFLSVVIIARCSRWHSDHDRQYSLPALPCLNMGNLTFNMSRIKEMERIDYRLFDYDTIFNDYQILPKNLYPRKIDFQQSEKLAKNTACIRVQFQYIHDYEFQIEYFCDHLRFQSMVVTNSTYGFFYSYQKNFPNVCDVSAQTTFILEDLHIESDYRTYLTIAQCPLTVGEQERYYPPEFGFSVISRSYFTEVVGHWLRHLVHENQFKVSKPMTCDCGRLWYTYTCSDKQLLHKKRTSYKTQEPRATPAPKLQVIIKESTFKGLWIYILSGIASGVALYVARRIRLRRMRVATLRPEPAPAAAPASAEEQVVLLETRPEEEPQGESSKTQHQETEV